MGCDLEEVTTKKKKKKKKRGFQKSGKKSENFQKNISGPLLPSSVNTVSPDILHRHDNINLNHMIKKRPAPRQCTLLSRCRPSSSSGWSQQLVLLLIPLRMIAESLSRFARTFLKKL
jgi:hypothetical protein